MNPIKGLLISRKFWALMLDVVISIVLYFVGKYGTPSVYEDIKFLIAALQPVFVMLIASIAYEDVGNPKPVG